MKRALIITLLLALGAGVLWLGIKDALVPFSREDIRQPIYTVGDLSSWGIIDPEAPPIVFGPAFWGAYTGARAFPDMISAQRFLKEEGLSQGAWGIFRLSGDFTLDTYDRHGVRYIARTLLVLERAD